MKKRRLAIVSGSEGGIGHALMTELANRGYQACGIDIVKKPKVDITASLEEHFKQYSKHGDIKLVINCAGITQEGSIEDDLDHVKRVFDVNFFGVLNVCREAIKYMDRGAIVNIASKSAFRALPRRLAYCASKGAVVSASKQMALDLAPNIRVNSVSPGMIDTNMRGSIVSGMDKVFNLLGRKGNPKEVAEFVCDVAENEYITGQDFIIDGGYCAV